MASELNQSHGVSRALRPLPTEVFLPPVETTRHDMRKRIEGMAHHMTGQLQEHETAQKRTQVIFEALLQQMEEAVVSFRHAFSCLNTPLTGVYARVDADRSVGIMQLLWHTVSFTTRGNTTPMALNRSGREPQFVGRIIALLGDYTDQAGPLYTQDFPDLLAEELASLYIPACATQPAVMIMRHRREELFFHPNEAAQQFLLKVLETTCGGGYFHEAISP